MEWDDARIISSRNEERKKRYTDLNTGMYIKEQLLMFEKCDIEDLKFTITLPQGFLAMNQEMVSRKYPSLDRPDIVIGNDVGDTVFAFSALKDHISTGELRKNTATTLRTLIKAANPSISFMDSGNVNNDFMSCCWFDFKSYIITGVLYNLTNIVSFKNRTILGMFSCPYELQQGWKTVYLKILETYEEQAGGGK